MLAEAIVDRAATRLARELAPPQAPLTALLVDGHEAGLLDARRAQRIARFTDVFVSEAGSLEFHRTLDTFAARTHAVEAVTRQLLAEGGLTHWRGERYQVASSLRAEPMFEIERAAAHYFGIASHAVHVNATTRDAGGVRMWISRRSPHKAMDPGMLDNLVAGGVAAGTSIVQTLAKEAYEEASIAAELASTAVPTGSVRLFRDQIDGLQRETIHVFDLDLPAGFSPRSEDGEVADYRLATIEDVASWIGDTDGDKVVTADASLVIADWLLRHAYVPRTWPAYATLDALRGV